MCVTFSAFWLRHCAFKDLADRRIIDMFFIRGKQINKSCCQCEYLPFSGELNNKVEKIPNEDHVSHQIDDISTIKSSYQKQNDGIRYMYKGCFTL